LIPGTGEGQERAWASQAQHCCTSCMRKVGGMRVPGLPTQWRRGLYAALACNILRQWFIFVPSNSG
jgi:hypothetical protein